MEPPSRREFLEAGLIAAAPTLPAASRAFEPAYLRLERSGELAPRAATLYSHYRACRLCPRQCGVDRTKGQRGVCSSAAWAKVYSAHPHFGEERPLVGRRGSGTIFFSNCNLLCVFCQNWEINHRGDGSFASEASIARLMLELQQRGCHNINLVTPTHVLPNIVGALRIAIGRGLRIPLVYNCAGYEPVDVIQLLDGIVDIYLPDFKYLDGSLAAKYSSGARDYPERAAEAIAEMHRQVGELVVDPNGVALRGLMIRHLVLPNNIAGTDRFVQFVATKLTRSTYVNIMAQYRPEYKARAIPELARRLTAAEYRQALTWAAEAGLTRLDPG